METRAKRRARTEREADAVRHNIETKYDRAMELRDACYGDSVSGDEEECRLAHEAYEGYIQDLRNQFGVDAARECAKSMESLSSGQNAGK
jgi:hypothetical protein